MSSCLSLSLPSPASTSDPELTSFSASQNAVDNEYLPGLNPSSEFAITTTDITKVGAPATLLVFNKQVGFSRKNIDSFCKSGLSTKKAKETKDTLGKKWWEYLLTGFYLEHTNIETYTDNIEGYSLWKLPEPRLMKVEGSLDDYSIEGNPAPGEEWEAAKGLNNDSAQGPVSMGSNEDGIFCREKKASTSTLTRTEVHTGSKKPFSQKKTGRARHGAQSTLLRPGSSVFFRPKPRDWSSLAAPPLRALNLFDIGS
ncbi:hypothetical protein RJ640_006545 [Escallonia rubra]|uniref:Large ribosomal subunit protein uL4c n=1 Tax=Escallonia rubra TaxID=112253 RepID=A0AA88QIJ2_9ASTE|nr:hypothetical protein RJ640_006545 [Escallonia rubra]